MLLNKYFWMDDFAVSLFFSHLTDSIDFHRRFLNRNTVSPQKSIYLKNYNPSSSRMSKVHSFLLCLCTDFKMCNSNPRIPPLFPVCQTFVSHSTSYSLNACNWSAIHFHQILFRSSTFSVFFLPFPTQRWWPLLIILDIWSSWAWKPSALPNSTSCYLWIF